MGQGPQSTKTKGDFKRSCLKMSGSQKGTIQKAVQISLLVVKTSSIFEQPHDGDYNWRVRLFYYA